MKLLLLSEGGRDVGVHDGSRLGAVRVLTRRVLESHVPQRPPLTPHELVADRLPRLNKTDGPRSESRRVVTAWLMAKAAERRSLAIVLDRDRDPQRLRAWLDARDQHVERDNIAIGIAVETAEAWLLADEQGMNGGLATHPPTTRCADPETFDGPPTGPNHPKTMFLARAAAATRNAESAYDAVAEHSSLAQDAVAEHSSLAQIEARCPSFKRFADELRARAK